MTEARDILACAICRASLSWSGEQAQCRGCRAIYPIVDGIPVLAPDRDAHKDEQARFFDAAEAEFEITRPHGTPHLYRWLIDEKFRRSVSALNHLAAGPTALSVCGGSGMDAEFLARLGARVMLADISVGAASRASERACRFGFELTPIVADIERLPFRDRSVDLVYVHDGLHHLERPAAGLAEMARVAARAVSISEPARALATQIAVRLRLSDVEEEAGNRIERVDPVEFIELLEGHGFRIVEARRYGMFYRHEPGPAMRLFSSRPLFPAATAAVTAFNAVAGKLGNKLTIQAVRD
ncbi:MAG: methyltransferase domain-containing protein [Chloroflexi bacterium]|nr:methyltransferase domain-containing protein [Chloroflexota bacterium]